MIGPLPAWSAPMDGTPLTPELAPDWDALLAARDAPGRLPAGPLGALFGPLLAPPRAADGCIVVGRLAQTLDGRIATLSGSSQWISGRGDLLHTHRLRALCHAVVVGAGTVRSDDPRLTTRDCGGPHPVRVVLDTDRRLGAGLRRVPRGPADPAALCRGRARRRPPRHRRGAAAAARCAVGGLRIAGDPRGAGGARPDAGIFVEGGGVTVSRFLAAGCLDRLHVTVAPVLLGSGIPAFTLPEAARIADGLRFAWTVHSLGPDVLFDIALDRARPGVCAMTATRASGPSRPAVGEICATEELPPRGAGPGAGAHLRQRRLARHRSAWCSPAACRPASTPAMRAPLMAGEFPFPVKYGYSAVGVVEAGPAAAAAASSSCTRTRTSSWRRPRCASRSPTRCRTAARCWRRTWRRRSTCCGMRGRWPASAAWSSAPAWSGCWRPRCWRASRASRVTVVRHRPVRAPRWPRRSAARFALPGRGARRAGADRPCQRQRGRAAAGARPRRLRGAHRRGELVWRPRRRRCRSARPSMRGGCDCSRPRSARSHPPCAAGAAMPSGWRWHWNCWPIPRFDALLDGPTRFDDMPAAMPRILGAGARPCHVITYGSERDVQPDRLRPHHDRPQLPRRGIRPGAAAARRHLRGGGGVPRAEARPPAAAGRYRPGEDGTAPGAGRARLQQPGRQAGLRRASTPPPNTWRSTSTACSPRRCRTGGSGDRRPA